MCNTRWTMPADTCPCQTPPGSPLHSAHVAGARVGARLDRETAIALTRYCSTNACNQSEAVRRALVVLAASTQSPEDQKLEALCEVLELPPDADRGAIVAAIDDLINPDGAADPAADPMAGDSPDPKPAASPIGLSAQQAAACRRAGQPATAVGWRATLAKSARSIPARVAPAPAAPAPGPITLSTDERAYCVKHKLTPEQFQARKAKAARTPSSK